MTKVPVTTSVAFDKSLEPRTLVIGLTVNGVSKAYPFDALVKQSLIIDDVGGVPIFIVLGDDKRSVRAFERTVDGRKLEFFVKPSSGALADWWMLKPEANGISPGRRLAAHSMADN